MNDHQKIWESIFGQKESAIDVTGQIILKNEFKTGKQYSWNYDNFDYEKTDEYFIANEEFIKIRNHQSIFEYKNLKYLSVKNNDFSYSILCPSKLSELNNPFNFDLFLSNKLNNHINSNNVILTITYKKFKENINDIFISYISDCIRAKFNFEYMKIDDKNYWKNKISYLIDKNKFSIKEILNFSLIIKTLINLFILRSNSKFDNDIWKNPEDELNTDNFFNVCLFLPDQQTNIISKNELEFINYLEVFENKLFLNENYKNELEKLGMLPSDFIKIYENNGINIYHYNFINTKFNTYYLSLKNKKK